MFQLKSKFLTQKETGALVEFRDRVNHRLGDEVLELKIFGSKARGDSRKDSDIDVLVVLKKTSEEAEDFIIEVATQLLLKHGVDISPHIYSKKEKTRLLKVPSIFFQIVEKEAISL